LCLHPTNQQLGHKVIVGLGAAPSRAYALELVQRGFVTLAPAYPHLANYAPDLETLGYASGTMKAIWDNIRALDLLEALPFVKAGGFGAVGHSLGGHNAIFTAVFDPRIRVVVSSCGFDSFVDYYGGNPKVWQPDKGWTQDRYMPRLAGYADRLQEMPFDFFELIAALAPRHVFVSAPTGDTNFEWQSVARIGAAAGLVFGLQDASDRLEIVHPNCGHEFPEEIRVRAYRLLEEQLRN
jgi:dienelactone hydrolase